MRTTECLDMRKTLRISQKIFYFQKIIYSIDLDC